MAAKPIAEYIRDDLDSYLARLDHLDDDMVKLIFEVVQQMEHEAEQARFDRLADNSQDEQARFDAIIKTQQRIAIYGK